jgi:ABC-type amino acid transport substrate-binding protein
MKKTTYAAVLLGIIALLCGVFIDRPDATNTTTPLRKLNDLNNSYFRLGLPLGAQAMYVGEEQFTNARLCYFNSHHSAYSALLQEKIDGYLFDSHTLDYVAACSPDCTVLPGSAGRVDIAVGVAEKNADLLGPINQYIDRYKQDGTYQQMYARWVKPNTGTSTGFESPQVPDMPQIAAPHAPTRTLVVGTCSQLEPMCFLHGEEKNYTGFDIELLRRLALHLNVRYIIQDMDYVSMIDKLARGELDIVIAGLNKTDSRMKRGILFSKNYIDSHIVAIVRKAQVPAENAKRRK